MSRISLCSSSISASWLPASSFCGNPGRNSDEVQSSLLKMLQTTRAGGGYRQEVKDWPQADQCWSWVIGGLSKSRITNALIFKLRMVAHAYL
jgi:hypothetical protein